MKREVMLKAWELFRKGFDERFGNCLKAAWELIKLYYKYYATEKQLSAEELEHIMRYNRDFKHRANHDNLDPNVIYRGKGIYNVPKINTWVKKGIARMYAEEYIDELFYKKTYIQSRI